MALAAAEISVLADCFESRATFGTGGVRAPVGVGPGCVHEELAAQVARGHARWLRQRHRLPSVVIGWDVRRFEDHARRWTVVPPSARGLSSRRLAEVACEAYLDAGVEVWWPGGVTEVATPEVSFLTRHLHASGAMVLTASHNPPDDNGLKLYDARGVQLVPPYDGEVVAAMTAPREGPTVRAGVTSVPEEALEAYLEAAASLAAPDTSGRVVVTALHGCGRRTLAPALRRAGIEVVEVAEQRTADGAFPTVPGHVANPERPEVLDLAISVAEAAGVELVMAADPDADRLGVAVRDETGWRALDGHEIAAIALHHLLQRPRREGEVVLTTEVTTRWLGRLARAHGVEVVEDLPVGFKFLGSWLTAHPRPLLLAAEESHGLLSGEALGDKDAAGAAVLLASAFHAATLQGQTLLDVLDEIRAVAGPAEHVQRTERLGGPDGRSRLQRSLERLRRTPPAVLAAVRLTSAEDRRDDLERLGLPDTPWARASADQLVWTLGEAARVIVRPSGTEPKVKVYAESWREDLSATDLAEAALALL